MTDNTTFTATQQFTADATNTTHEFAPSPATNQFTGTPATGFTAPVNELTATEAVAAGGETPAMQATPKQVNPTYHVSHSVQGVKINQAPETTPHPPAPLAVIDRLGQQLQQGIYAQFNPLQLKEELIANAESAGKNFVSASRIMFSLLNDRDVQNLLLQRNITAPQIENAQKLLAIGEASADTKRSLAAATVSSKGHFTRRIEESRGTEVDYTFDAAARTAEAIAVKENRPISKVDFFQAMLQENNQRFDKLESLKDISFKKVFPKEYADHLATKQEETEAKLAEQMPMVKHVMQGVFDEYIQKSSQAIAEGVASGIRRGMTPETQHRPSYKPMHVVGQNTEKLMDTHHSAVPGYDFGRN